MELNAEAIVATLKNIVGGEVVETPLGRGLSVSSREAFLFSSVAGGTYFENQIFPFTPKGLLKIFYNANDYNFVTGIFDNSILKNTPYYIAEQRSYIKDGPKVIVPIEISSENQLRLVLRDKYGSAGFDTNIILFRVDISKKGYGLESFMEYLACKHFINEGYVTENQIPLSHKLGSPDFGGYGITEIQDCLERYKLLNRGFNVLELGMLRVFPETSVVTNSIGLNNLLVGEAKTSTQAMEVQIRKYISSGYFDSAVEIHPHKKIPSDDRFGMLYIDNHKMSYRKPVNQNEYSDITKQKEYREWLKSYFNCYLLSNYTNDELNLLCINKLGKKIDSKEELISLIKNISFKDHLDALVRFLKYGTF
jgi:hypothetical protein